MQGEPDLPLLVLPARYDGKICLWDVVAGQCLHRCVLKALDFSCIVSQGPQSCIPPVPLGTMTPTPLQFQSHRTARSRPAC